MSLRKNSKKIGCTDMNKSEIKTTSFHHHPTIGWLMNYGEEARKAPLSNNTNSSKWEISALFLI
jgi:hypothetical protein